MEIRAARPSDRAAIRRFLRKEDPHDYVLDWMDRFDRAGRFYLLLDAKKIAGIFHGKLAPDGSAWMSAARVGQEYRGQGWMMRITAFALSSPGLRRAQAARMLITHDNRSSLRAARKGGYAPVSVMTFLEGKVPAPRRSGAPVSSGWKRATPAEFRKAALHSPLLRAQRGLAYMSFTGAFALTPRSTRAVKPCLFISPEHGPLLATMFADTGERWIAAQVFHATRGAARALKAFAREKRADSYTVIVPALESARRPFRAEGYTLSDWARRVFVFEKRLPVRRATSSRAAAAATRSRRR